MLGDSDSMNRTHAVRVSVTGKPLSGKLASLNRSWQSNKGTFRASGLAGIEPMPSESE